MTATIEQLREAKFYSDRKDWPSKHRILRRLITERPDEFHIDSSQGDVLGITHVPTNFKFHLPRIAHPQDPTDLPKPKLVKLAEDPKWEDVPLLAAKYAVAAAPLAEALYDEPDDRRIWWQPETGEFLREAWGESPDRGQPWVTIKQAIITVKDVLRPIADAFGQPTDSGFASYYGGARPVAGALSGGLIGAGLGYGAGSLAEWLMPGVFSPGSAKTRAALLGGLIGATPGLAGMALNHAEGKSIFDKYPESAPKAASLAEAREMICGERKQMLCKSAQNFFMPNIDVHQFNNAVWQDPLGQPGIQAAASGLAYGASVAKQSPLVSPFDVARVAIGAGSGYASATLLGKTFGMLAGLSPDAQKSLQNMGIWAGMLKSVIQPVLPVR